jgi:hypothetical protein
MKIVIHKLRLILNFGLLGALAAGVALGWHRSLPFDPRWVGLAAGAVIGTIGVIWGSVDQKQPQAQRADSGPVHSH